MGLLKVCHECFWCTENPSHHVFTCEKQQQNYHPSPSGSVCFFCFFLEETTLCSASLVRHTWPECGGGLFSFHSSPGWIIPLAQPSSNGIFVQKWSQSKKKKSSYADDVISKAITCGSAISEPCLNVALFKPSADSEVSKILASDQSAKPPASVGETETNSEGYFSSAGPISSLHSAPPSSRWCCCWVGEQGIENCQGRILQHLTMSGGEWGVGWRGVIIITSTFTQEAQQYNGHW